jgi:hypothetical protein
MPQKEGDSPHQPFKGEIEGMLRYFNEPLIVIYVAPYTTYSYSADGGQESPQSEELKARDLGLDGIIQQYSILRRALSHRDSHIFLYSKWDVRCDGLADPDFVSPQWGLLDAEIFKRYPLSFARFQNVNFNAIKNNKTVTNYCSGIIHGNSVLVPSAEDQHILNHFPRKLWNWLYFTVTQDPLYRDVHPKPDNILDKLLRVLRR